MIKIMELISSVKNMCTVNLLTESVSEAQFEKHKIWQKYLYIASGVLHV